jgi:hypothetical protein
LESQDLRPSNFELVAVFLYSCSWVIECCPVIELLDLRV